jgi:hypothetical protein
MFLPVQWCTYWEELNEQRIFVVNDLAQFVGNAVVSGRIVDLWNNRRNYKYRKLY